MEARLKGQPVLVNLWATWCAPCVKELPTLNAIANRADVGIEVVTVSQDMGDAAAVQRFLDERGLAQLPAWLDSEGALPARYGVQALPMTVLYDAEGKEVWRWLGDRDWTSEESLKLLSEAVLAPQGAS
jgi:thiol-disulfide isomerase/thioredoxin